MSFPQSWETALPKQDTCTLSTTRKTEKLNVRKSYSGKLSFYSNLVNKWKQIEKLHKTIVFKF